MRLNYRNVSGYYEGDVRGGNIPTGCGTQRFENGHSYDGFFLEGKRRGYGEARIGERLSYRGEWCNDKRHGCGYAVYDRLERGHKYIGYFAEDCPHGFGVCFYDTGEIYVGEWDRGAMHGKGTYIYADKASWDEGWWNHGERDGVFFSVKGNTTVEKRIYRGGRCLEARDVTLADRWLNNLSGVYGSFEKNGKVYYGKYVSHKRDGGDERIRQGWALEYGGLDEWDVSMYHSDVRHGESVGFVGGVTNEFSRCFFVDGEQVGLCIEYQDTYGVTCFYDTGKVEDGIPKAYGIKYEYDDYLYVGDLSGRVPHGSGIYYSFETGMLSTVIMSYFEEIYREDLFKTDDVFGCSSVAEAQYPGSAIDASETRFLAGGVDYSFSTGEKSVRPDRAFSFDREGGILTFSSPDGTEFYSGTPRGERSYLVKKRMFYVMTADGNYSIMETKTHEKTLLRKERERLSEKGYALDCPQDGMPEWGWSETNGGYCVSFQKEHTKDRVSRYNMSYHGATSGKELSPCGFGVMTFPGIGIASGKWNGSLDCENAVFLSYETGRAEPVTIEGGIITFDDGTTFNYTEFIRCE